ncbi:NUDIX hydrolase N-terminal domain-containing protein [Clostridium mediterraneense]|uniref:NUDIX hydrolase N-terminal domain-containing protein n=1 Tax=Clostridium mediterraneense TaxID=1805472 RepID=UPI00083051F4|nr:NUDIX hydrolase [Clostridium mediterraneense]
MKEECLNNKKLLDLAIELQAIGQIGETYCKDKFDLERFKRIREIAAEILSMKSDFNLEKVKELFCNEKGYQTPKLDSRAAIFKDDKILLVKEKSDNTWSLPGGWVDVNESIRSNIIKEVEEEAGLKVSADKIIAIQDRNKHNIPPYAYGICKIFILCNIISGEFKENIEIEESGFFSLDNLPDLSVERNTEEQIKMCFYAYKDKNWTVLFD